MTVILERLTGAFALNCELFFLTLLFSLPLGLVVAFGSMSRCAPLRGNYLPGCMMKVACRFPLPRIGIVENSGKGRGAGG